MNTRARAIVFATSLWWLPMLSDGARACEEDSECNDGEPCTSDRCMQSICYNFPQYGNPCYPPNGCYLTGRCESGWCRPGTPASNGTPCNDGNECTTGDVCTFGACAGAVIMVPQETENLSVAADKVSFSWSAAAFAFEYDVVRGSTGAFPFGPGGGDEFCWYTFANPVLVDPAVPAVGTGFWYISRGKNSCGKGTYGTRSDGSPRITATCL